MGGGAESTLASEALHGTGGGDRTHGGRPDDEDYELSAGDLERWKEFQFVEVNSDMEPVMALDIEILREAAKVVEGEPVKNPVPEEDLVIYSKVMYC